MKFTQIIFSALFSLLMFNASSQVIDGQDPKVVATEWTNKMKVDLNLVGSQIERVRVLNEKAAIKIDAIERNNDLSAAKKAEYIEGNFNDRLRVLKVVLNENQYNTFVASQQ